MTHPFIDAELLTLLATTYGLTPLNITAVKGGWSAYAFQVEMQEGNYFLKAYDKRRGSTPRLAHTIDCYGSFLAQLPKNLQAHVPHMIKTLMGQFYCEDERGIYLLHKFIAGEPVGEQTLTQSEVTQFAQLLTALHQLPSSMFQESPIMGEVFALTEHDALLTMIDAVSHVPQLDRVIAPHLKSLSILIEQLNAQGDALHTANLPFVVCHQDLHHGNIMRDSHGLIIIDWEGILLAPKEADLMFIRQQPYYEDFLRNYNSVSPINADAIHYFEQRRLLDDIFEWLELTLEVAPCIPPETLTALTSELEKLDHAILK